MVIGNRLWCLWCLSGASLVASVPLWLPRCLSGCLGASLVASGASLVASVPLCLSGCLGASLVASVPLCLSGCLGASLVPLVPLVVSGRLSGDIGGAIVLLYYKIIIL